jgi:hypothetical protein
MNDKIVLLVAGKIESGKNTFVNLLQEYLQAKMYQTAFALPLKDMCKDAFRPLMTYLNLHGGYHLPFTTADSWYEKKNEMTRMILQAVGTDIVRKANPDYWIERAIETITSRPEPVIALTDWRFPSEYIGVNDHFHTVAVRVRRPANRTAEIHQHISETALDNFVPQSGWDYDIDNSGTLIDLRNEAQRVGDHLIEALLS